MLQPSAMRGLGQHEASGKSRIMTYVRIELWPSGIALLLGAISMLAMRALEGYAHSTRAKRTRDALQRALNSPRAE
jgi:hypothetical protein